MVTCIKCGESKDESEYAPSRLVRNDRQCRKCVSAYNKAYKAANKEKLTSYGRAYRAQHKDRLAEGKRVWREQNIERLAVYIKKYQSENLERWRATDARRRSRAVVGMDATDRKISLAYRKAIALDSCFYCGASGEHDDHFFPLVKGGTDHWWNLVRACKPCNLSKKDKCGTVFILKQGLTRVSPVM